MGKVIAIMAAVYIWLIFSVTFRYHDGVYYNCLYSKGKPEAEKACNK